MQLSACAACHKRRRFFSPLLDERGAIAVGFTGAPNIEVPPQGATRTATTHMQRVEMGRW